MNVSVILSDLEFFFFLSFLHVYGLNPLTLFLLRVGI